MHLLKIFLVLLLILSSMSCATVSHQQQLNYKGNKAYLSGRYQEALQSYEKTLRAANKNRDQQYIAIAMYGLGRTNIKLCRLDEAEKWLKQSIIVREKVADNDEAKITQNISELARLYSAQQRYLEANVLFERSLPLLYQMLITQIRLNLQIILMNMKSPFVKQDGCQRQMLLPKKAKN